MVSTLVKIEQALLSIDPSMRPPLESVSTCAPLQWLKAKVDAGWDERKLIPLLVRHFSIKTASSAELTSGFWLGDGFYDNETQCLYLSRLTNKHFKSITPALGVLTQEDDGTPSLSKSGVVISTIQPAQAVAELIAKDFASKIEDKAPDAILFRSGFTFAKYKQHTPLVGELNDEHAYWLSRYFSDGYQVDTHSAWEGRADNILSALLHGSSSSLFTYAGDDTEKLLIALEEGVLLQGFARSVRLEDSVTPVKQGDLVFCRLDEVSADKKMSIRLNSLLESRKNKLILLSSTNNLIDLYSQLRNVFSARDVSRQWGGYEIRVKLPELCPDCREDDVYKNPISNLLLGFTIDPGTYSKVGNGCCSCFGGYCGWVTISENTFDRDNFLAALEVHERESKERYLTPHQLISTFKQNGHPTVFLELGKAIQHNRISARDGKMELL